MSTTYAAVQSIVVETLDETLTETFIAVAHNIITANLSDEGLSAATLELIERFLTAHLMFCTVKRQTQTKRVGDASESYAKLGEGLKSTTYGAIVLQLDTTGILSNIGKTRMLIEAIPSFDDSEVY